MGHNLLNCFILRKNTTSYRLSLQLLYILMYTLIKKIIILGGLLWKELEKHS